MVTIFSFLSVVLYMATLLVRFVGVVCIGFGERD